MIYEGNDKYIFVSYAHKDSCKVMPIVDTLSEHGFRIWYDSGIEAGTEWPEYIEDHLSRASVVLIFMTPAAIESRNCRNEINFALELQKDILVIYLEDTQLLKGMRLQLNSTQSLFRNNHNSNETFIKELLNARIIQGCCENSLIYNDNDWKEEQFHRGSNTRVANVCSIGTNDENDMWPEGLYSQIINRDEFRVVFFHMNMLKPFDFSGTIHTEYRIYNSNGDLIFDDVGKIDVEPGYDKLSMGWILKGTNGSFIPSGNYRFVCSVNNSPEFSYMFTVCSDADVKRNEKKEKSFLDKIMDLFR